MPLSSGIHGQVFGWSPPDVPAWSGSAQRGCAHNVRAWINEWNLVRLDSAVRPAGRGGSDRRRLQRGKRSGRDPGDRGDSRPRRTRPATCGRRKSSVDVGWPTGDWSRDHLINISARGEVKRVPRCYRLRLARLGVLRLWCRTIEAGGRGAVRASRLPPMSSVRHAGRRPAAWRPPVR